MKPTCAKARETDDTMPWQPNPAHTAAAPRRRGSASDHGSAWTAAYVRDCVRCARRACPPSHASAGGSGRARSRRTGYRGRYRLVCQRTNMCGVGRWEHETVSAIQTFENRHRPVWVFKALSRSHLRKEPQSRSISGEPRLRASCAPAWIAQLHSRARLPSSFSTASRRKDRLTAQDKQVCRARALKNGSARRRVQRQAGDGGVPEGSGAEEGVRERSGRHCDCSRMRVCSSARRG